MESFTSALDLAKAVRSKELSPVEIVDYYLERSDQLNPRLNAVTWRRDDELRAEAKAAEDVLMRGEAKGAFFGVPIAIKDMVFVEGWPISFGSRAAIDNVAFFTSEVIEGFRRAGFLLMYRTNAPEFGVLPVTENQAWGATHNPWDLSRTPGGSSGGSAAAVASGMAPIAHANDGGGSIRIPASCCGLVGLKPSRGRVSSGPLVVDAMHGAAVEGCVSRTVAETAAVLDAISAFDSTAWYNAPAPERPFIEEVTAAPGRLRVAFSTKAPTGVDVDACCVEAVEATAKLLEDLGHEVFEGEPSWADVDSLVPGFITLWCSSIGYWPLADWQSVEPLSAAMRERALATSSLDYVQTLMGLQIQSRAVVASWGRDFDVWLTPTLAIKPPKTGYLFEGNGDDPMAPLMRAADMVPFTPWFNISGQPAVSLPLHRSDDGVPIGVQLVGRPWGEAELLRLAGQLEQAAPWAERHPALE